MPCTLPLVRGSRSCAYSVRVDTRCSAEVRVSMHGVRTRAHAEPASPEGVAADATAHWGAAAAQSPDVIINVSADSTAAFSAWAMGTRAPRCSLADLTGAPSPSSHAYLAAQTWTRP